MDVNATAVYARAEANPHKRQRLSEEPSPQPCEDSVAIEALPPDELNLVDNISSAIELRDDDDDDMALFSTNFHLDPDSPELSPTDQLHYLLDAVNDTPSSTLQPQYFDALSFWLAEHVSQTPTESVGLREQYLDDGDFFSRLGTLCFTIFQRQGPLFAEDSVHEYGRRNLSYAVQRFVKATWSLAQRLVHCLPGMIDSAVSRRDSAQTAKMRHPLPMLCWVQVLAQLVASHQADCLHGYCRSVLEYQPQTQASKWRRTFPVPTVGALSRTLQKLAQHHREINNAWDVVDAILRVVHTLELTESKAIERLLDTIHTTVLPLVCAKHPRALPDSFHQILVEVAERLLGIALESVGMKDFIGLYVQYVKSDHDGLVPEHEQESDLGPLLQNASEHNEQTLRALMTTSWALQAYRSYIFSEIMDVRSTGLALLRTQLLQLFNDFNSTQSGLEHPLPQYAARFLRKNEVTKYIFGPESHTSLVKHSQDIIAFLAVTGTYTDLETDTIWNACTNSAEADFARAAALILEDVARYLDVDHLLHLAKKYTTTEPAKLGQDAVGSLTVLFQKVQVRAKSQVDEAQRLATAFISIDIMKRVDETPLTGVSAQLRDSAKMELFRFTQSPQFSANDRAQILIRCVPHIKDSTRYATTCIEIAVMFLQGDLSGQEMSELLNDLSIDDAVEELGRYVTDYRKSSHSLPSTFDAVALGVRFDLLLCLLETTGSAPPDQLVRSIFDHAVGTRAICNDAREVGWRKFGHPTPIARGLLLRWLKVEVATLPPQYTTQGLLEFLGLTLHNWLYDQEAITEMSGMLEHDSWTKLVQTAESQCPLASLARDMVCQLLFRPPDGALSRASILGCHRLFTTLQIRKICDASSGSLADPSEEAVAIVLGKVEVLQSVLAKSKEHAVLYTSTNDAELRMGEIAEENAVYHVLEVQGIGRPHPQKVRVRATAESKVKELLCELPGITGATEHRMIVAGHQIDLNERAGSLLSDLGGQTSGVIAICPKFTIRSELGKVLTGAGVIEEQVLEHHSELERLLDGPAPVAAKAFELLVNVPLSDKIRGNLSSEQDLDISLTSNSVWRTMFHLERLHQHLRDLACLGVADATFVARGTKTLLSLLSHQPVPGREVLCQRLLHVLTSFLREEPPESHPGTIIDEPVQFSQCVVRICEHALSLSDENWDDRHALIKGCFDVLHEMCRRQPQTWHTFTVHSRAIDLHASILFRSDPQLSIDIATLIKNLVTDQNPPNSAIEFYTKVALDVLPQAMAHPGRAAHFFDLATRLLLHDSSKLWIDETSARCNTKALLTVMWNHNHIESEDLAIRDVVLSELFGLIRESVRILRSFKKPLEMPGLAAHLFSQYLFVDDVADGSDDASRSSETSSHAAISRQLFHPQSRHEMYELIKAVCTTKDDFQSLLDAMVKPLNAANDNPADRFPGRKEYLRPVGQCAGLTNLGQTCYMNSLLQQLFANVGFRQFILDTPTDNERPKQQPLLQELKWLFSWMQNGAQPVITTAGLARVLGTEVSSQEDVHGFYEDFLSKLDLELPSSTAKGTLARFFTGKLVTQIKGECGHISPRTESFVDLPIVVKNKRTLAETLDELVQGEPMQGANQYRCQSCDPKGEGRLVDAMRRSCPDVIPDNLTFCLKRFEFDPIIGETKVNDRFEFPETIDMSKYQLAYLDNPDAADIDQDVFELVGVIVHMGTNGYGHYWSYTLLRNSANPQSRVWIKLEDSTVTTCRDGLAQVQHECFGGLRFKNGNPRTDNAYVLFYQRKHVLEQQIPKPRLAPGLVTQAVLPVRVLFDSELVDEIRKSNVRYHRNAHLFDDDLSALVEWILSQTKLLGFIAEAETSTSPEGSSSTDSESDELLESARRGSDCAEYEAAVDDFTRSLSDVTSLYLQRIAPCHPQPTKKLNVCFNVLQALLHDHPALTECILRDLARTNWFSKIQSARGNFKGIIQNFLWRSLAIVREYNPASHDHLLKQLRDLHSLIIRRPETIAALDWSEYLSFAARAASIGPNDTAAVLDSGYWSWVFEMIRLPFDVAIRGKYPGLFDHYSGMPSKIAALYEFVLSLLENHLSVSETKIFSTDATSHLVHNGKALLTWPELVMLAEKSDDSLVSTLFRAARFAEGTSSGGWREFAPGKLLGFLVGKVHNPRLYANLRDNLVIHIDTEEDQFSSVLSLTMHFCVNTDSEEDARLVFGSAAKITAAWSGSEGELLQILPSAIDAIPRVVLLTLDMWVKHLLLINASGVRDPTAAFVVENVFNEDADLTDPDTLVARASLAARLVREGGAEMRQTYYAGRSRSRFEALIQVYKYVQPYLQSFRQQMVARMRTNDAANLPTQLKVEFDRAQHTLSALEDLGTMVEQWELSSTSSLLASGVVRSREDDSDVYESDGDEEWDDSSELN